MRPEGIVAEASERLQRAGLIPPVDDAGVGGRRVGRHHGQGGRYQTTWPSTCLRYSSGLRMKSDLSHRLTESCTAAALRTHDLAVGGLLVGSVVGEPGGDPPVAIDRRRVGVVGMRPYLFTPRASTIGDNRGRQPGRPAHRVAESARLAGGVIGPAPRRDRHQAGFHQEDAVLVSREAELFASIGQAASASPHARILTRGRGTSS